MISIAAQMVTLKYWTQIGYKKYIKLQCQVHMASLSYMPGYNILVEQWNCVSISADRLLFFLDQVSSVLQIKPMMNLHLA